MNRVRLGTKAITLTAIVLSAVLPGAAVAAPRGKALRRSLGDPRSSCRDRRVPLACVFIEATVPDEGSFSCTGTVIAPKVVLTAGHCVESEGEFVANPASSYIVTTGVADVREVTLANESTVSHAIFYPNFESARPQIDAGLLILDAPVAAPALPMATPSKPELRKPGTPITIAVWGLPDPKSEVVPKVLRAAEGLKLQSTGFCQQHIPDLPFDFPAFTPASQSCALDTPNHTVSGCFGDSGGPAIAHRADGTPVEIGIIVKGSLRCAPTQPNVFTQGRPDFCVGRRMDRVRRTRRTKAPHSQAGATVPRGRARRRSRRPRRSPVHCGTGSWAEPEGKPTAPASTGPGSSAMSAGIRAEAATTAPSSSVM